MLVACHLLCRHPGSATRWPLPPARYDAGIGRAVTERTLAQAKLAEDLGFDWITMSEHHYMDSTMIPSPLVFAAALSQRTSRIKIGVMGPVAPSYNPVRLAEEIAMVDVLSDGRLIVLLLRGTEGEMLTYYVNKDETRAMTQEATQLIVHALTEPQPFAWEGDYYRYRNIAVWPGVVQQPHPRIYYSGMSETSAAYAAKHRLGLAVGFHPPKKLEKTIAFYREEAARHGWEPAPEDVVYRAYVVIGEDEAHAQRLYDEFRAFEVRTHANNDSATAAREALEALGRAQFRGTADTIVEQIHAAGEAGIGVLELGFQGMDTTTEELWGSMEMFAREVLPRVPDRVPANALSELTG